MAEGQVEIPRELLEALAPADPINQDEQGGCVWCAKPIGHLGYGYASASPRDHEDDCPWLRAQRYLD